MVGDTLKFQGGNFPEQIVDMVISDTDIQLKAPGLKVSESDKGKKFDFKVIPKLDQTHVFESVIDRLIHG